MKPLYLAPLEGIDNYIYRNAFCRHYSGVDRFYTPFIDINSDGGMKQKSRKDILPENNAGICLIPQVLTKNAIALGKASKTIRALGYEEINLNLGCPSPTVTKKGKGSALLSDPAALHGFLEDAFSLCETKLSVKIRIGATDPDEWEGIMDCLNDFPLSEVIIHPRLQSEGYGGQIHEDVFRQMLKASKNPVCVNPSVQNQEQYCYWAESCPEVTGIMIGRALISDPSLAERIHASAFPAAAAAERAPEEDGTPEVSGRKTELPAGTGSGNMSCSNDICSRREGSDQAPVADRFFAFHDDLLSSYRRILSGDVPVLFKMKELWVFWEKALPVEETLKKKLAKTQKLSDYEAIVALIRNDLHSRL